MKTYTIEDIANFEKDECGRLICPSGDYSQNDGQLFEKEIAEMSETITAGMEDL